MALSPAEAYDIVVYQVGALLGVARAAGARVSHVKPHGALYNMAAARPELADALARAIRDIDASLAFVGLSGSAMIDAGASYGLRTVSEAFADRQYLASGALVPRSNAQALVSDFETGVARAIQMVHRGTVGATDGTLLTVKAETLCVHGDTPHVATLVRAIRTALIESGVTVAPLATSIHT